MLYSFTRVLLFLTAFALPLTVFQSFVVGPFVFSISKTMTTGLLLWMPVVWLASRRPYPRDRKLVWLAVFFFAVAVSLVTSFFGGLAALNATIVFSTYAAIGLFYVLVVYLVTDTSSLRAVFAGYAAGIGLAAISVLAGVGLSEIGRTGGYGGDPNHFSYDAAIGICCAGVLYLTSRSHVLRLFWVAVGVAALSAIIASVSRSGFVAVLSIFGLWMLRFRRFNVLAYALPALLIVGVGMFAVSDAWRDRMGTMTSSEAREADGSIMSRYVVGEYAIRAFASNPITGVGFLQFGTWASTHVRAERQAGRGGTKGGAAHVNVGGAVHNSYLHVAAEMGIIGLVPYLAFLGLTWFDFSRAWLLAKRRLDDPEMKDLYYMAILGQVAFFGALVDNLFLSSLRYKSIWLLFGLSTVVALLTRERMRLLGEEGADSTEEKGPLGSVAGLGDAPPLFPTPRC
jgi:O-antigen ligase